MTVPAVEEFRAAALGSGRSLISGEVQFWRMDPADWAPALRAVSDLGIRHIATYLSWRRHEPRRGEVDFTGAGDPRLDVRRFLELCGELDLSVQLKPGPWICAEEPGGGLPDWLLSDSSIIARDHADAPVSGYNPPFKHPMPSYASTGFRAAVREWYHQVWSHLADFTGSAGPIVATQLDNEPSVGFQDSMYGFDYHPQSVRAFRAFAQERYGLADAEPPRPGQRSASEGAWMAYQQHYIADYLAWLQELTGECGVAHLINFVNLNTHPVRGVPQNGPAIASALGSFGTPAVVGEDHYFEPPVDDTDLTGLAIACAQGVASGTSLVWAPEMQSGIWRSPGEVVGYPDPTRGDLAAWWGASLAFGYQGFNLYMLVDRENWEFAPVSPAGDLRPVAEDLRRFVTTLEAVGDLAAYRPVPQVNLAWDSGALRSAYRSAGTQSAPVTPWTDEDEQETYRGLELAAARLVRLGIQFRLCAVAADVDPGLPTVGDPALWPAYGGARVSTGTDAAQFEADLRRAGAVPEFTPADSMTLARLHRAPDGRELLLVVSRGDGPRDIALDVAGVRTGQLLQVVTGDAFPIVDGRVVLSGVVQGLTILRLG